MLLFLDDLALKSKVAQLQTQLEDEKAVRQGLERALVGVEGAPSAQVLLSNLDPQVSWRNLDFHFTLNHTAFGTS